MGAVIVAVIVRQERELVAEFRARGATSAERALPEADLNVREGIGWRKLVQHAAIRHTDDNRFYLDEPSWEAIQGLRHRMAVLMLFLMALIAILSVLATAGIMSSHPR